MCVKQIAHTYRYCCGSVLHQSFISTMNQFHGCGSSLNHAYFNKEAVLQLWQISTSWVFQQGSSFYKSHKLRFASWDLIKSTRYQPLVSRALHLCQDTAEIEESYGGRKGAYEGSTNLSDKIRPISRKGNRIALMSQVRPPPSLSRTEVLRQSNLIGKWKRWKRNLQSLVNGKHSKGL